MENPNKLNLNILHIIFYDREDLHRDQYNIDYIPKNEQYMRMKFCWKTVIFRSEFHFWKIADKIWYDIKNVEFEYLNL